MQKYAVALILLFAVVANAHECPSIKASRTAKAPKIDGKLDDGCWKNAEVFSNFTQGYPNPGASPTFKTEVKVVFDKKTIYIGVNDSDRLVMRVCRSLFRDAHF